MTAGPEEIRSVHEIDLHGRKLRGLHLAGDKTIPDELIKPILIGGQCFLDGRRVELGTGRTDGFVRVLCVRLGFVYTRLGGTVILTVFFLDIGACGLSGFIGNPQRVGTHIGDQTLYTAEFTAEIDSFVQLLCNLHRPLRLEIEFPGRFLL